MSTTCGRGIGVLFQFWTLSRGKGRIAIRREHLALDPKAILRLVKISGNGIIQAMIGMASWIGIVRIISAFGSSVVAGYTIGMRIIVFAILPSWGLSNAAATMVGQNLGARKPDRSERSVYVAAFYNMIFLGSVGLLFVLFAPQLIRFVGSRGLADGDRVPGIVSYGFLFYAIGLVMTQAFNGAGDTWTPTRINFFIFWPFESRPPVLSHQAGMGPQESSPRSRSPSPASRS